jgi:hypothetical protein
MEVVVSKMRTLGRAIYPLRHEYAESPSPGKRLVAIAALQVLPDFDLLNWLADRLEAEKPFVGYHALVALLLAIRSPGSREWLRQIEGAVGKLRQSKGAIGQDTDRMNVLGLIEAAFDTLKSTT